MTYDEITKAVDKLAGSAAKQMDFDIWWTIASGDIVKEAERLYPLIGKIKNPFDRRTRAGKYIQLKKKEARENINR